MHHKTDVALMSFNFIKKTLVRKNEKNVIRFFVTFIFYQRAVVKKIIIVYGRFIELCTFTRDRYVAAPPIHYTS